MPSEIRSGQIVPAFPLPNVVFFPETQLPLHIFEPRYRQMIRDIIEADRLIALFLLAPGWEQTYYQHPDFHPIGSIGKISQCEPLADGRYNIVLEAVCKVRAVRVIRDAPYQKVEVTPLEERVDLTSEEVQGHRTAVVQMFSGYLAARGGDFSSWNALFHSSSLAALINTVSQALDVEHGVKQQLLELNSLAERCRQLESILRHELAVLAELRTFRALKPKDPRWN
ncbi:MAG: LON peptidase substrate-binding domain-containing protein [Acidobacteria bacterium]|nr:LON peptidase substrate-binding domain-containing protein [Acidobacteriota bacterium]